MTKLVAAIVAAGMVGASAFASQPRAGAEPAASKVVDRDGELCGRAHGRHSQGRADGEHGHTRRRKAVVWKLLPTVGVEDLGTGTSANVAAGNPLAPIEPGFPARPERLFLRCVPDMQDSARIAFSRRVSCPRRDCVAAGLRQRHQLLSGKARSLSRTRDLRRADLIASDPWTRQRPGALGASGTIAAGYLAVASASGKPLAYGEVFQNGKGQLVARSCDQ